MHLLDRTSSMHTRDYAYPRLVMMLVFFQTIIQCQSLVFTLEVREKKKRERVREREKERRKRKKNKSVKETKERAALLDRLPGFLLKASVDGLGDGGLHQVNVAHHQGREQFLQVLVERPVAQVS